MTSHIHWFANSNNGQAQYQGAEQFGWVAPVYFDFSNVTERRKFVGAAGQLLDLGADGSAGTGVVPVEYYRGAPGDFWPARNFGSGGDVAVNDPWLSGFAPSTYELTPY